MSYSRLAHVLGFVLVVTVACGAWVCSLPHGERQDVEKGLYGLYAWDQGGFKEPIPERLQSIDIDSASAGPYVFAGLPLSTSNYRLIPKDGFLVAYDEERMNPAWVAYRIDGQARYPSYERPRRFASDPQTMARVVHGDYTGSGYDRGHMAPNYAIVTRYGKDAQADTFLMSNIVPQSPALNQGPWRMLEEKVANQYAEAFDGLWVVTGPIYDDDIQRLPSGVEIPDSFFKVILGKTDKGVMVLAFIMDQAVSRRAGLNQQLVSVDTIEWLTGLDFYHQLPDDLETRLEALQKGSIW